MEDAGPRPWPLVADRLGRPHLPDDVDRGRPAPDGHKATDHLGYDLKPGYLHPDSVGADRVYTLKVLAFDAKSGKPLWERTVYDGVMYDNRHRKNTYASSTMATDGKAVYAFFESADSTRSTSTASRCGRSHSAASARRDGARDVADRVRGPADPAVRSGDGRRARSSSRSSQGRQRSVAAGRTTRRSWATPLVVRTPARVEMVTAGAEMVVSYDPRTGKELWRANGTQSHPIPSAVAGHGLVFLTAGSQAKRAMAIKLGGEGDLDDSPAIVWRYNKGTAYVPSPILHGPYLYLMTDSGIMTCLEAETGKSCTKAAGRRFRRHSPRRSSRFGDGCSRPAKTATRSWSRPGRARGRAHELGRRAGLRVTRACRRHHLHPRRAAPVASDSRAQQQADELAQHHRGRAPDLVPEQIEVGILDGHALADARAAPIRDASRRSSSDTSRISSTSPGAATNAGRLSVTPTTGCSVKPLTMTWTGVSSPSTRTVAGSTPISSEASRSAACASVSPGSVAPPGRLIWPAWRGRPLARTVSGTATSSRADRAAAAPPRSRVRPGNARRASPAAPARRELQLRLQPGSVPARRRAASVRRSTLQCVKSAMMRPIGRESRRSYR